MDLEDYWGIGPKTRQTLNSEIGTDKAIEAIQNADVTTLVDAGVSRGRVVRILRRATESESYLVRWDHVAGNLSVVNVADGTDVTSGTDVGEVILEVVGA